MKKINWQFMIPIIILSLIYIALPQNKSTNPSTHLASMVEDLEEEEEIEIDSVGYDELDKGDIIIDSIDN